MLQLGLWGPKLSSVGFLLNLFQAHRKTHFLVPETDFTIGKSTKEMKRDNTGFRNLPFSCSWWHTIITVGRYYGTATAMLSGESHCLHDHNLPNAALTSFFLANRAFRLEMLNRDDDKLHCNMLKVYKHVRCWLIYNKQTLLSVWNIC